MSHTLFHERMINFYVDLDNTIIYSYKHEIGPKRRCAEIYQGREISFLTEKTWQGLRLIAKLALVIPTTTRTLEQYKRVRLEIGELPYVLACNGGVLLRDGREDPEWYAVSRKLVEESRGEMEKALELLSGDDSVCFEIRWVKELFVFTKSREPEKTAECLSNKLNPELVAVFQNGPKVYVMPRALHKGAAVKRLQEQLGSGRVIAAGDSIFDLPMLEQAEIAIAPESLAAGWKGGYGQSEDALMALAKDVFAAAGLPGEKKRKLVQIPSNVLFSEGVVNTVLRELLVRVAKREKNQKRPYLVVNPLQAKHVPADPRKTLEVFDALAELLRREYEGEKLLLIGFAETATAIGARLAIDLDSDYIQTTRENLEQAEYLFFTESHSHATEQRLVKNGLSENIKEADRVIFVEDEVTTGDTIAKLADLLQKTYRKDLKFAVASLLNGMDKRAALHYQERKISVYYLVKTDHSSFAGIAESYSEDGRYESPYFQGITAPENLWGGKEKEKSDTYICRETISGAVNPRRITSGASYRKACQRLWERVYGLVGGKSQESVLVLGTEECMYPAIYVAAGLSKLGCRVKCHATTRSPIAVSRVAEYPLHCRYELPSLYEEGRRTFVYELERYDKVLILTDAGGRFWAKARGKNLGSTAAEKAFHAGAGALCSGLAAAGNTKIYLIRWCES